MLSFKVIWKNYDFTLNRLAAPTPAQAAALAELAADPGFDPGGYRGLPDLSHARFTRCKVCRTFGAPQRVCGYCRARVRMIRNAAPTPKRKAMRAARRARVRALRATPPPTPGAES